MDEELEQIRRKLREKIKELSEKSAESRKYISREPLKPLEQPPAIPLESLKKAFDEEERVTKEYRELLKEYYEILKRQRR